MKLAQLTAPDLGGFTPPSFWSTTATTGTVAAGLVPFFNNLLRIIFLIAGLYAVANIFFAGILFVNARGNAQEIERAWYKIWQSLAGLAIVLVSFVVAIIIGAIFFGDPQALLNIQLYGPGVQTTP